MFSLYKPTDDEVRQFIISQQYLRYSYAEIGTTKDHPPTGYNIDHNRILLGTGEEIFAQAKAALGRWEMINLGWMQLYWPNASLAVDTTVAVLAHTLGLWVLNACRIVYVLSEPENSETFGFAYGTLPGHVERGEERFTVQWNHTDDSVWYDILAFSRPNHLLTRIGYPYVRYLQKRFAKASQQAMLRAVRNDS